MSVAMTTVPQEETEKFQTKSGDPSVAEKPPVENVWAKRTLEKQLSASVAENKSNEVSTETKNASERKENDDFQEVKSKKDKKDERKDDKSRKIERKDSDKRETDKKEKKSEKEEKKEEIVKKFDNVNYVEAPLPKTNPWATTKNFPVIRSQSSEAGM